MPPFFSPKGSAPMGRMGLPRFGWRNFPVNSHRDRPNILDECRGGAPGNKLSPHTATALDPSPGQMRNQTDQKNDQKDDEQDLRNARRRCRYSGEAEDRCNNRKNQKHHSPIQHSLLLNFCFIQDYPLPPAAALGRGRSPMAQSALASPADEISSAPVISRTSFARLIQSESSQWTESRMPPFLTRPS